MPDDDTNAPSRKQETRLAVVMERIVALRRRIAKFAGDDPDAEVATLPRNIAALQEFLDDDHPACAHLREQFWSEIDGHVDTLDRRLNRALKISAAVRRQGFRLIDGNRP